MNNFRKHLSILCLLVFHDIIGFARETKKISRVDYMDNCFTAPDSPIRIETFRLYQQEKASTIVYVEGNVIHDITEDPLLEIGITKCNNKENPDTCEPLPTLKPNNACGLMFMKGVMWSDFVSRIEPPASCRMKKGHYVMKNASFNPDLFKVFPIDGYYWKLNLVFRHGNNDKAKIVVCVEGRILSVVL